MPEPHGKGKSTRYPFELKLAVVCAALDKGLDSPEIERVYGVSHPTLHRWKKDGVQPDRLPGPAGPAPVVVEAMRREVSTLRHSTRRTWGTATIYEHYHGIIPKRLIHATLLEERSKQEKLRREQAQRYEFAAPDVAWSGDFQQHPCPGRVLRVQDERSRCTFAFEHRAEWSDRDVARFVGATMTRYGPPLVFKHDRGPEFASNLFQALLRGERVIPLPNPPYYAPANGKHERVNRSIKQWLLPIEWGVLCEETVLTEVELALLDHDAVRGTQPLGGRTPREVYANEPRVEVDRNELYTEWLERFRELMERSFLESTWHVGRAREFEAMRLAALAVLQERNLVVYNTRNNHGPEAGGL